MKIRSVEEQFEPEQASEIRRLQARVDALRTSDEASSYFLSEATVALMVAYCLPLCKF